MLALLRSARTPSQAVATADKQRGVTPELLAQAVDNLPVNVMLCDVTSFEIIYANPATVTMIKRLEHLLPIKAENLVGTCIDVFHKNPVHQRRLLSDPKNLPFSTQIKLGDEVLDLLITAITDHEGAYVAAMLTWSIVTEKVKADQEAARLLQMVDYMPINVITCDPVEFKINYLNKTSVATLKTLQHLLPMAADKLLGETIDIFHKNPTHQRAMLADGSKLPHQANIRLGDEVLQLKVSAIRSKSGDYLGPMLTWNVITDQVRMTSNVSEVVDRVSSASTDLQATAQSLSATAEETSRQSMVVAAASEQMTANVGAVASAAEEMAQSIAEIARQVAQAAVSQADHTNATMQGLADAAQTIGQVTALIDNIAGQTNLLALNATIEAARAGEAGKGFAVVASEVKALAGQTAKATGEISSQIAAIQSTTQNAVEAIKAIGGTIGKINDIATAIAASVEEQGAATQEISRNAQQASNSTKEVADNIAGVKAAASHTGESAATTLTATSDLSLQASQLRSQLAEFLEKLGVTQRSGARKA